MQNMLTEGGINVEIHVQSITGKENQREKGSDHVAIDLHG